MARRGRPRKRGTTRMDAAIDAMKPMGFPEKLVIDTVKELLKEYDEDDDAIGFPFIEEGGYALLIETILEKEKPLEGAEIGDASRQDDASGANDTKAPAAGPLGTVVPVDSLAPGRRRPLYGWIDDDDDERPVELTPFPLLESVSSYLARGENKVQVKVECES